MRAGQAARPQLLRALNEQLLLQHIRQLGQCSRAELARLSGLSKPTVSLALANVERSGLVREAGQRTGQPGRSAVLYEIRPDAGYVLGLDIGHQYLRGALADLSGEVVAKASQRSRAVSVTSRVSDLVRLADELCGSAGLARPDVTQTVIGSPGVYDPRRGAITLTGGLAGLGRPAVLDELRAAFGDSLVIENDADAAALAEREHGLGSAVGTFAFVWVGTGVGMGLVIDGKLHPQACTAWPREIAFMPISSYPGADPDDARRRGAAGGGPTGRGRGPDRLAGRAMHAAFGVGPAGLPRRLRLHDERAVQIVADEAEARGQGGSARSSPSWTLSWSCWAAASARRRASPPWWRGSCPGLPRSCRKSGSARSAPMRSWTAAWPPVPTWPGNG